MKCVHLRNDAFTNELYCDDKNWMPVDVKFCEQCKKEQEEVFKKEAFNKYRKSIDKLFKSNIRINIKKRKEQLEKENKTIKKLNKIKE